MELSDYTIIVSSTIIVAGWFVNSFLNRRHEIHRRRLDFRLETLHSFLPVFLSMSSSSQPFINDSTLNQKIKEARVNFQLYGHQDEIRVFDCFVEAIEKQDTIRTTESINKLINLVRGRIRAELKLPRASLQDPPHE